MADDKNEERKVKNEKQENNSDALPPKLEKIAKEIEELSVLELSELVSSLQDRLGVSPMAASVPAAAAATDGAEQAEGKDKAGGGSATQTVTLTVTGDNKISVIKALREINPNLGLKEAKDITEATPKDILENVKAEEAQEAKKKLEEAGATVELK